MRAAIRRSHKRVLVKVSSVQGPQMCPHSVSSQSFVSLVSLESQSYQSRQSRRCPQAGCWPQMTRLGPQMPLKCPSVVTGSWPSPDEEGAEESGVAANGCLAVREHDAVDEEANKVRDRVRRCKLLDSALARSCFRLVAYLVIW